MAQHISLKFQNAVAGSGLALRTIGLKVSKLPERNITHVNWTANHISIKFQGATQLQTLGINLAGLPER